MEHKVESVMTAEVVTAKPMTPFRELVELLERRGIGALPVVDDRGRLVGIVTRGDLLKLFLRPDPAIAWEVRHELLEDRMGESATDVDVEVRDGVVTLTGKMDRRSQVRPLLHAVKGLDGVVGVDANLAWRVDDLNQTAAWPIA
jgi:CBS domain-containing protein